ADLLASNEYLNRFPGTGGYLGWMNHLYHDVLGRPPDDAGAGNYYQGLVQGKYTMHDVAMNVLLSDEGLAKLLAQDYTQLLDRPARAADKAHIGSWVQQMQAGVPEQLVIASIIGGPGQEFFNKVLP